MKPLTYKDAGVDIDAGNALVDRIKPLVKRTHRPEVLAGLGGFGGLFALPPGRYREPVLVSGTFSEPKFRHTRVPFAVIVAWSKNASSTVSQRQY